MGKYAVKLKSWENIAKINYLEYSFYYFVIQFKLFIGFPTTLLHIKSPDSRCCCLHEYDTMMIQPDLLFSC